MSTSESCYTGFVLPNYTAQLSGTQRISIRSATTIYDAANIAQALSPTQKRPAFKSGADYIAYKKASSLVNAKVPGPAGAPFRPPPTSLLLNPVCSVNCSEPAGCIVINPT